MKKLAAFSILILALAGCKKSGNGTDPGPGPGPGKSPIITAVGQPIGNAVQAVIGPAGGTISSADGKASVNIPAGALEANQAISIQRIENKVPMGVPALAYRLLPHGLQFKKPASLILKYSNADTSGTAPELFNIATQTEARSWKKVGALTLNKVQRTVTASLEHFSDYSFYNSFELADAKTGTVDATFTMLTTEEILFNARQVEEWGDMIVGFAPALYVKEWAVNGQASPPPGSNFGYLVMQTENPLSSRMYVAPRRAPDPDTVAISVKIDVPGKAVLYLVRNVAIDDINKLTINGTTYPTAIPLASVVPSANFLSFQCMQTYPNNRVASVVLIVEEQFNAAPGTYQFSASPKVKIVAQSELGKSWYSQKMLPDGTTVYLGQAEITVSGTAPDIFLKGRITGNLFGEGFNTSNAVVDVTFAVMAK